MGSSACESCDGGGLREQALDEPPRLEQRPVSGRVRPEDEEHQGESDVVEDAADRPEEQHEATDIVDLPLTRSQQVLVVHSVERNRKLREVVEQVLGET